MLELKNITKTYTPKKGVPVQALRGVDLSFEDRGMVFILGKSGSGKSTLLNIIGGLDSADGGEIIIDGKSTKGFKESDYDNYRNTYVGFVFQEYNILNDFTVGENISLAVELQNGKVSKERVDEILKEVGLEGYADRKPNELSGGQKQRVAIARALIKTPEIIMADEPTGALDSETGRSIFELLKKLSEDKLVVVVSHDREFAEEYGDRIIELSDGEVIADKVKNASVKEYQKDYEDKRSITRSHLPFSKAFRMGANSIKTKPVRLIITIILCLISFAFFGLADTIAAYNKNKTAVDSIINNQYESLAITSGYGALSSDIEVLKNKTGLDFLGVVNFDGIGQELNVTYKRKVNGNDGKSTYYNLMMSGYLPADKIIDGEKYKLIAGKMPENDNDIVVTKYTYEQMALGGITLFDGYENQYIEPEEISDIEDFVEKAYLQFTGDDGSVIIWKVTGVVDTLEDKHGRYSALKPSADNDLSQQQYDILVSECYNYFAYSYHSLGYVTQKTYDYICSLNTNDNFGKAARGSVTFKKTNTDGTQEKFVGKFSNVADDSVIDKLEIVWANGEKTSLQQNEYIIGLKALQEISNYFSDYMQVNIDKKFFDGLADFSKLNLTFKDIKEFVGLYIGSCEEAESLGDSELNEFKNFIDTIGAGQEEETRKMLRGVAVNQCYQNIEPFMSSDFSMDYYAQQFTEVQWRVIYAGYLMTETLDFYEMIPSLDGGYVSNIVKGHLSGEEIKAKYGNLLYTEYLLKEISAIEFDNIEANFNYGKDGSKDLNIRPEIVGVYIDDANSEDIYIINNGLYAMADKALTPEYLFLITQMPSDEDIIGNLVNMHFDETAERSYNIQNSVMSAISLKDGTFNQLGEIFLYVGIGLALFSIVLMSNYIAVSISSQTKEIGIIRAIGATKADVFKIFYSECLIISLINFVLSTIAAWIVSFILNASIVKDLGLEIIFISFGVRQVALLLALSIFTALIACLFCTYAIAKRKPVDCIGEK